MGKETKLVQKWLNDFGINTVIDAEDMCSYSPESIGWDLQKVWTCWDSYDEMGCFVSPGFEEKEEVEGELFVSAWFLGSKEVKGSEKDVVIVERETCDECDTQGCESCEDLGWLETDYLAEIGFQPDVVSPGHKQNQKIPKFCSNCGDALQGKFCSNCGHPAINS